MNRVSNQAQDEKDNVVTVMRIKFKFSMVKLIMAKGRGDHEEDVNRFEP